MPIDVHIANQGTGDHAKVTKRGELVTASFDFSTPVFQLMSGLNVAHNFFVPIAGKQFVITDVIADADRLVGNNGVAVDIYEANSATDATISKQILKFDMVKQTDKVLIGLNLAVTQGKWVNAKMDDNNVAMTIGGYYVPI